MSTQLERSLQAEVCMRLGRFPLVAVPVPNGLYIPSRDADEARIAARIINRMKADGMLLPGAPDLFVAGAKGALCVELKRPVSHDLFGRKPRGRLSPEQKAFQQRCVNAGVEYLVADCWADVECRLPELF